MSKYPPFHPETPPVARAFIRRFQRTLQPNHPSFALVVLDDDGKPWTLTFANRTGLVVAGAELMSAAVGVDENDPCACPNCDNWTDRARAALAAMTASDAPPLH